MVWTGFSRGLRRKGEVEILRTRQPAKKRESCNSYCSYYPEDGTHGGACGGPPGGGRCPELLGRQNSIGNTPHNAIFHCEQCGAAWNAAYPELAGPGPISVPGKFDSAAGFDHAR